jgi:hypothetical protein
MANAQAMRAVVRLKDIEEAFEVDEMDAAAPG